MLPSLLLLIDTPAVIVLWSQEMELAATNAASLEAWLSALQSGIDFANGQGGDNTCDVSPLPQTEYGDEEVSCTC